MAIAWTLRQLPAYLGRTLLFVCLALLLLLVGVAIATYEVVAHQPGPTAAIDCSEFPPSVQHTSPWQAVFTARVLHVSHIDSEYAIRSGHRFGPWAIAYVKHRYWGLPWWSSQVVLLAPDWYQEGETYFVSGERGWYPHSKFLPVVYTGPCKIVLPLTEAAVYTRVLSQGPPRNGVRIIGRTYRRKPGGGDEPAPGMRVEIKGPSGSLFVTSDADAVYDMTGLPAGHYSIQIEHPSRRDQYEAFDYDRYANLVPGDVWGRPVYSQ